MLFVSLISCFNAKQKAALLTEQKILFHSQHYVLLITVLQSLIDLLLPFQWPHTYIPTGKGISTFL